MLHGKPFKQSNNTHDWLGPGIYFCEANPYRGLEWAHEQSLRSRSRIKVSAVVGAVIDMGSCLDLTTKDSLDLVKVAYDDLTVTLTAAGTKLPVNTKDKLRRNLDCAVINRLHFSLTAAGYEPIQTVKGVFPEGGELYSGSGFENCKFLHGAAAATSSGTQ